MLFMGDFEKSTEDDEIYFFFQFDRCLSRKTTIAKCNDFAKLARNFYVVWDFTRDHHQHEKNQFCVMFVYGMTSDPVNAMK